jgi:ABC-type maltose transport system permease subunit
MQRDAQDANARGAQLAPLPVVVLYFLAQRFVVAGLAAGAVRA